ncbi:cytochrome P450 [Colletotrichum truncatum]|uniref:Cytochrome P450 n=1 Tax=Colletotrichum truncatum TaxID=5467 RepID=A0ACC3ZBW2_COLTU|nr:cytochrome P450 [Colletotrichum truncatum]KAF6783840.1 cytochrome P450 [Colletotrichum truncatum]
MFGSLIQLPLFIILAVTGAFGLLYWIISHQVRPVTQKELRHIPELRFEGSNTAERYINETRNLLKLGYEKYLQYGVPFQMRNPIGEMGPQVFLPIKYLDEVKRAPTTVFSFEEFSEKSFLLSYSHAPRQTDAAVRVIKDDLNSHLGSLVNGLWTETIACLEETVSSEWITVPAYHFICSVVARTVSYGLVGPHLCRSPDWQRIVIETTYAIFGAANTIRDQYTPRWRWLARWTDSTQKQLRQIRQQATKLLTPLYKQRLEAVANPSDFGDPSTTFQDTIYWLLGREQADKSLAGIVDQELFLSIAAIHTTSGSLNSFIFDWIAHPEYHDDIIAEVNETLSEVQSSDKKWTMQHVAKMKKLDSFIKESARMSPIGFDATVTGQRLTLKPHTFKDGLHIPAGTTILFHAEGEHYNPNNYREPDKFDGYRFYHLREKIDPSRFHYTTVSDASLNFGAGQHSCPGRFFSALVTKFILVQLITKYEVKLEDGSIQRPPDDFHDNNMRPGANVKIKIRRVD